MGNVNIILDGQTYSVPEEQVGDLVQVHGARVETDPERNARLFQGVKEEQYGGAAGAVNAALLGAGRAITLGATDAAARALGAEREIREIREQNPIASAVGEVGGGVAAAALSGGSSLLARAPAAAAARAGAAIARAGEGAGVVGRIAAGAAGAGAEGVLQGIGSGVSDLALSTRPIDAEHIASVLSSRALFGGVMGAGAGALGKAAELGLSKARGALEEAAAAGQARATAVTDDLVGLDMKGLRAAERAEIEAIEAARVPQRKAFADELAAAAKQAKDEKVWLATQGAKDAELRVIGKQNLNATRQLDRVLDNPKFLADNPKAALAALQKQEHALEQLASKAEGLRPTFAADETGVRAAALDRLPGALERNRALQAKIGELTAAPTSGRLSAIEDARAALMTPAPPKTLAEQMAGGTAYSAVAGLARQVPILGPIIAPFLGAKAASVVGDKVFGRVGKAVAEAQARGAAAVARFLGPAERALRAAPPLATRVLSSVAFAPEREEAPAGTAPLPKMPTRRTDLITAYRARSEEVRSQVAPGPDGRAQMRPEARGQLAARLAPIGAYAPHLADGLEAVAARKIEYLADTAPRRPEIGGIPVGGPDRWHPTDLEIRSWARRVAAAEDPMGVIERLAEGAVVPEDVETMRAVYPELHADFTAQIVAQLPQLRQTLPYARRIALSIFTGAPVDPAMDPTILATIQAQFGASTDGPRAQPQFGSVRASSAELGTASQRREMGAA